MSEIPDDDLFVCPHCDLHSHADSVGDKCKQCGEDLTWMEELK